MNWRRKPGPVKQETRPHPHFMCGCSICGLSFEICGIPCFVFCPGCQAILTINTE
jgi:hypothetical protein